MPAKAPTLADIARVLNCGDTAFTVELGDAIDPVVNGRVVALADAIRGLAIPGVVDLVPTFRSLTVHYDNRQASASALIERFAGLPVATEATEDRGKVWDVPALYGGAGGQDLADLAASAGLDPQEAAALHASVEYRVYMLGFLPGFAYLGDLPEPLRMPRLDTPRTRVPRGAIAIADAMTAIYPSPSPGGWRLIGMTPIAPFDAIAGTALFAAGDRVRFRPVEAAEYREIERAVRAGTYQLLEAAR